MGSLVQRGRVLTEISVKIRVAGAEIDIESPPAGGGLRGKTGLDMVLGRE
jgi:hypothetical protein